MKHILLVGSQHGNEILGELLYAFIQQQPDVNFSIDFFLANPRARQAGRGYIESDMNRSFGQKLTTYEGKRADELVRYIKGRRYDLVIDAHTTNVVQDPSIIVHAITTENADYLRASHIEKIVVMKHPFVRQSLIGNAARAVSLEVSVHDLNDDLLVRLYADIRAYAKGEGQYPHKSVFVVDELLERGELPATEVRQLKNFVQHPSGFYPVLVGEREYSAGATYLGFRAKEKQEVTL